MGGFVVGYVEDLERNVGAGWDGPEWFFIY